MFGIYDPPSIYRDQYILYLHTWILENASRNYADYNDFARYRKSLYYQERKVIVTGRKRSLKNREPMS